MNDPEALLQAAEAVVGILGKHEVDAVVIGAGGHKSKADIVELIAHNPELDLDEVRKLCARYRLKGIEELVREAR